MNYNSLNQLSLIEKIYLNLHQIVYQYRLSKQTIFENKIVISIGNLSMGGTGKTPLTIFLSEYFLKKKHRILICLRGYKGNFKDLLLVSENGKILTTPYISGDEAYLIAYKLIKKNYKDFKVVCGKNKEKLIARFGTDCDIILLDDAFQNPSVYKNIEIVLIDTNDDPSKIKLLPMGNYREPISALQRTDIILLTRIQENQNNFYKWKSILDRFNYKYFLSNHKYIQIEPKLNHQKEIIAVCGIGNPNSFFRILEEEKFTIVRKFVYRDHYTYTNYDIQKWIQYQLPIVLTEKDWIRILYNSIFLQHKNLFYKLEIELEIINQKRFFSEIQQKIRLLKKT